jgi:hypothetical protein
LSERVLIEEVKDTLCGLERFQASSLVDLE